MNAVYGQPGHWHTLGVVAALHGAVILALLSVEPVAEAVGLQTVMVSLLPAPQPPVLPKPLEPQVRPQPTRPQPAQAPQPQPAQPQAPPVLAAPEEAPSPVAVPALAPTPAPTAVLPPPAPYQPQAAALVAPPEPPLILPRFDADYLDNPPPSYPPLSRRLGEHGRVLLRVLVNPDGTASQVEIRESSGYARLDKAARDAVQRWRFVPARQGDQGVAAWVLVPISFSLQS